MNQAFYTYKQRMKGKRVAVIGLGVSNTPLVEQLCEIGSHVTVCDRSEKEKLSMFIDKLIEYDIEYRLGQTYLDNLTGFDYIFRTPGMRFDLPELIAASSNGTVITSEMEVFMEVCPAMVIAVTGSDGKTTTTTLIYKILSDMGYNCWLGGNIGNPLLSEIEKIKINDKVVLELSSFQLHTMKKSPHIAVITNITPNHLDVHKSMEEYIDAKKNIFKYQKADDTVVLNYDNDITRNAKAEAIGNVVFFSRIGHQQEGDNYKGALLYNQDLKYNELENSQNNEIFIVNSKEIVIPGVHNVENYLAATAAVMSATERDFSSSTEKHAAVAKSIRNVATSFGGVEHRIEFVREQNGVKYYNGSIASSPNRTAADLASFDQKVILIAGGKDKKIPYDMMGDLIIDKVKRLVLIGQTAQAIHESYERAFEKKALKEPIDKIRVIHCDTMEEAVKEAKSGAESGDIVILSPASTSFDMFRNFEERGNIFKGIVQSL